MIEYHDIEQKSDEWFELRKGKLTGSHATPIKANGKGLETYCKKIVLEMIGIKQDSFQSKDMERGNDLEALARTAYELHTGLVVTETGLVTNSKFKDVSVSPDGLIGKNGGAEIKCRNDENHLSLILGDKSLIPTNQIQMTLKLTEREWWDFVNFNPNFSKPLFIKRIYPDDKYFEKLDKGFETGRKLIKTYFENYNQYGKIKSGKTG